MGLTATDISLLLELRGRGWRPARIATIGRLSLYLHPAQHRRLLNQFPDDPAVRAYRWGDYCEAVLLAITGASEATSIDASEYESATVIHDMNQSISVAQPALVGCFDLVIDGGSLEHIFNFPIAVKNMMDLCRTGGYIMSSNPANNLCGHGFYQFTPELMYRLYARQNGFMVEFVLLTVCKALSVERDRRPRSFRVTDPAALGHRILVHNRNPVMINTLARKVDEFLANEIKIQQSDYTVAWECQKNSQSAKSKTRRIMVLAFMALPYRFQTFIFDEVYDKIIRRRRAIKSWRGILE